MIEQKPSVGRIVHYVAYGTPGGEYPVGEHLAAIITAVHADTCVSLAVLNPTGMFFNTSIGYDGTGECGGTWHWPEGSSPTGCTITGLGIGESKRL